MWPILGAFEAKGHVWKEKYLIVVLIDKFNQFPYIGMVHSLEFDVPLSEQSMDNIVEWQTYLYSKFSLRPQDFVMIVPYTDGKNIEERWNRLNESEKELWREQIKLGVIRQYYYVKGLDLSGGFFVPPGYMHLVDECKEFFKYNPDYSKNVFIMMKFDEKNIRLGELTKELKLILSSYGLNATRADDKMYFKDRDLWNNVCVYMICSKYGIAILENHSGQEYNPNVAIEYGFMRALDKPVLLLADSNYPRERADVSGKERVPFNIETPSTVRPSINTWVKEITATTVQD
jgi:hypothetical protein